ncbi:flavodoxin family protein [Fusobacterium sp. MFO224]|uniref:flavodoxin family protein n=1 Tax=Fusobacterium sp. MFO224 TaxID=3378070 RepID=UPI0038552AC3
MKVLFIYYSYEGTTDKIAKVMGKEVNGDLIRLKVKDEKNYKNKLLKYAWGGMKVLTKKTPEIQNLDIKLEGYDIIIIGTPVWAGTYAPAIRTLFENYDFLNLNVAYFYTDLGGEGHTDKSFKEALKNSNIKGSLHLGNASKNMEDSLEKAISWVKGIKL